MLYKEPTDMDWRLYVRNIVSYYIFISISIINIENKMYKYSSSKNHEPT